jgi:predicted nicotinamide N-methyase
MDGAGEHASLAGTGVPAAAVEVDVGAVRVRLWRAAELSRFVDTEGLLRADDPPEPPYWMHLWPGAMALARLLAGAEAVHAGARLLELGCGLALPALVAARRGAAVVATDWQRAPLEFARHSAASNGCTLHLLQTDWRAAALRGQFDVCVGADVGYDRAAEPGLVETLARVTAPGGVAWLADSVNTARDSLAAGLATAGFAVRMREVREYEDGRPVWVRIIEARR